MLIPLIAALALSLPTDTATYRVYVSATDPLHPHIAADVTLADGRLLVGRGGGIDHLENAWATFIEDLSVRDPSGRELEVSSNGPEGWTVAEDYSGHVQLSYTANLEFTTSRWPPGNEQAGLWNGTELYVVTKALFVRTSSSSPAIVSFDLPAGWSASTPWDPVPGHTATFRTVADNRLIENTVVVGPHPPLIVEAGRFTLVLALVGLDPSSAELVSSTLGVVAEHVGRLFDETPPSRYMMTLLYPLPDDGEGFETSAAFATATRPREDNKMLWGNNLAHELYHVWIGGYIAGTDETFEWFDEGFTDYYADLTLVQEGLIESTDFMRKMEKVMARYGYFVWTSVFPRVSLAEASRNKGRNRFAVYDGGWSAAFCLDVRIRKSTDDRRSLDDLMRLLYDRFAKTHSRFTILQLAAAVRETTGDDLDDFFNRHVLADVPLPLEDCLQDVGLEGAFQQYAAELWLSQDPLADPAERKRWAKLVDGARIAR